MGGRGLNLLHMVLAAASCPRLQCFVFLQAALYLYFSGMSCDHYMVPKPGNSIIPLKTEIQHPRVSFILYFIRQANEKGPRFRGRSISFLFLVDRVKRKERLTGGFIERFRHTGASASFPPLRTEEFVNLRHDSPPS